MRRNHDNKRGLARPAGVVVRYGVLFPLRVLLLICGTVGFFLSYGATLVLSQPRRSYYQQRALQMFAFCWGVLCGHGCCALL
jgi:hypothetical protein